MQTIKTAVVVVMLLAVLYGAYVALNGNDTPLPPELEQVAELNVEMGTPPSLQSNLGGGSSNGFFVQNSSNANAFGSQSGNMAPLMSQTSQGTSVAAIPPSPFSKNNLADTGKPFEPLVVPGSNGLPSPSLLSNSSASSNSGTEQAKSLPAFSSPSLLSNGNATSLGSADNASGSPITPPAFGIPASTQVLPTSANNTDPKSLVLDNASSLSNSSDLKGSSDSKNPGEWKGLPNSTTTKSYQNAKTMAMEQASKGDLKEALATLSLFYNAPELTVEQHQELNELLDPLAGEVIYSRRHLLDIPYTVGQGETLDAIAKQFEIPTDILAKINAVDPSSPLIAQTKLKIVPGPFRAEVSLSKNELTLFLGELYAGRFAIEIGSDPAPKEGVFQVVEKQKNRNFYGKGGTQIPGGDPRNPYGGLWIDLGQDICIHGTPDQPVPNLKDLGCICLSPIDANDVFGMLSRGSRVQIRR